MTEDNGRKRKCVNFTVKDKLNILKQLDAGASTTLVAHEHGLDPTTIRRWRMNRELIEKENNDCSDRKRIRASRYEKLNDALYIWFREMRARGLPVSGPILKAKALALNTKLPGGIKEFNANEGWLARFKEKYDIRQLTGMKEKSSVDKFETENDEITFPQCISNDNLSDCQIFHADETGLHYKLLPDESLVDGIEKKATSGFKQSADRVTILVCSNADGSCKLPLLVIGKSTNPRALKRISKDFLPVHYTNQRNAWMNRQIFRDWFRNDFVPKVTNFLRLKNLPLSAVLFLHNAPSHPAEEKLAVNDIKICFLPANVTSAVQFMDQSIVKTLKRHYRLKLLQSLLNNQYDGLNSSESLKLVTIKDVIYWVSAAWDEITTESISKSWEPILNRLGQAGNHLSEETESRQNLNLVILNHLNRLDNYKHATIVDIDNWTACDNDPLSPMPSDDVVIHRVSNNFTPEEETNDNSDTVTRTTASTALEAAKQLIKYCEESGNIRLDDFMVLRRIHDQVLNDKIQ